MQWNKHSVLTTGGPEGNTKDVFIKVFKETAEKETTKPEFWIKNDYFENILWLQYDS